MKKIESFFWGIMTAFASLAIVALYQVATSMVSPVGNEVSAGIDGTSSAILFLAVAALVEELLKYVVITKRLSPFKNIRELFSNAALLGLGFFLMDFLAISLNFDPTFQSALKTVQVLLLHIGTSLLIATLTMVWKKGFRVYKILTPVAALHFLFNFSPTGLSNVAHLFAYTALLLVFGSVAWSLFLVKKEGLR